MNNIFIYILLFLLGVSEAGIYGPVTHDMPMLQQKYDMRLDFDLNLVGATASGAYAFGDHWGVQGSLQGMAFPVSRYGGQLSAGWFTPMGKNNIVEVYAGASVGQGKRDTPDLDIYEALFQSYFVQADYGWCGLANSHIDIALGVKCGYLFGDGEHGGYVNNLETDQTTFYTTPFTYSAPFIEPSLVFRFGWEHLKFNLNASMTLGQEKGFVTSLEPRVGLGLNYYFNAKSK